MDNTQSESKDRGSFRLIASTKMIFLAELHFHEFLHAMVREQVLSSGVAPSLPLADGPLTARIARSLDGNCRNYGGNNMSAPQPTTNYLSSLNCYQFERSRQEPIPLFVVRSADSCCGFLGLARSFARIAATEQTEPETKVELAEGRRAKKGSWLCVR